MTTRAAAVSALRVGFAGTPPFAASALEKLLQAGYRVPLVLTQPDRPAGRGLKLQASAVKQCALQHDLTIEQPRSLKLDGRWPQDALRARDCLEAADLDVLVVAAYGLILPAWVLTTPRRGCLNIHGSLLPRWRGAAPIQRAIEAGDAETGITIMQMDEGLDTGDMLLTAAQPIRPDDTADSLQQRLATQGAELLISALARLQAGTLVARPQPELGVTYAHKIDKAEAAIDWRQDAQQIERRLRAFDPFPGATLGTQGQTIKVWRAAVVAEPLSSSHPMLTPAMPGTLVTVSSDRLEVACGLGRLQLLEVQPAGGRRMPAGVFLQTPLGRTLQVGQQLESRDTPAGA